MFTFKPTGATAGRACSALNGIAEVPTFNVLIRWATGGAMMKTSPTDSILGIEREWDG